MLETCLENKIIYDFLILYDQSRWHKLIPSLIEIAILNLKSSFNTLIFSEEDIYNIIKDLKLKLEEPFICIMSPKERKGNKERDIFYKPSTEWRPPCGFSDYEICDNNRYCFSSKNSNKRRLQNVKSKIKELVDNDKRNYYLNNSENNLSKSYNRKQRINYAISYDKNLEPEIIESSTIKKNKKKGKKIVQKMTQEEYEHKFMEENQNANKDLYNDENGGRKVYIQRRNQTEIIDPEESKRLYNNYIYSKNKLNHKSPKMNIYNKNKKNLYHYKTLNNKQNNNINEIFINNARQTYTNNNINHINNYINGNKEVIPKSQKDFENIEKQNEDRNRKLNNNNIKIDTNIKIENLSPDKDEKESDYDNNIYQFAANNNYGLINESDKNSYIGIEKKYEKKIDELERNILNNETKFKNSSNKKNSNNNQSNNKKEDENKNNIENYSNKIKVDITNMEEYEMKRDKNKNANNDNINYNYNEENQEQEYNDMNEEENNEDNNEEINIDENEDNEEDENEENEEEENINNDEENESSEGENNEDGFLSQMSNMTEKTKLLFKKAMDEYPPLEEDTFYGQIQSKNN